MAGSKQQSGEVGGYNLYYWQTNWTAPASINVGNLKAYTLTDLEAGQTYHFSVTAHDGNGERESVYSNQVSKTFPATTPMASFNMHPGSGTVPLAVALTDTSSGSVSSRNWTFGNGATSTTLNPSYTYTSPGTYTVTLTVTGPGGSHSTSKTIAVTGVDTDGDGLADADETTSGTNPTVADTDDDGINDSDEAEYWGASWNVNYDNDAIANNLRDPDADNDGYVDGLEIYYGSDPAEPISIPLLTDLIAKGEVQVNRTWQRVTFTAPFLAPVVVAMPLSQNGAEPAVLRIRNVTSTGFDIRLQEWDYQDGSHATETVSYLAMERGHHTLSDGTQVEAWTFDTSRTRFGTVPFKQLFTLSPVVIASIASVNEAEAVVGRVRRVNTANFQFRLQEQELNVQTHATETISYIAWEPLSGAIDGLTIEVNTTPDVVQHTFYRLVFGVSFSDTPVFVADMQTADGIDTANLRWQNKTSAGIDIRVAEEQSKGTEINHMTEVVGFIAIR